MGRREKHFPVPCLPHRVNLFRIAIRLRDVRRADDASYSLCFSSAIFSLSWFIFYCESKQRCAGKSKVNCQLRALVPGISAPSPASIKEYWSSLLENKPQTPPLKGSRLISVKLQKMQLIYKVRTQKQCEEITFCLVSHKNSLSRSFSFYKRTTVLGHLQFHDRKDIHQRFLDLYCNTLM